MGTRGSRGSAEKSPASGWEHLSVWGTGPWPTLKGRAEPASKPSWRRALFGSITKLPIDAALRAPRSPAPPPPPKGEGEETRRGRRGGSRDRAAAEGLGAEAARGAGGGRPRGARCSARRAACARSRPPPHGSRHLAGVFRDQSSPCLGCVPRSSKPEESRQLGVTAGLRSFLVRCPRAAGSLQTSGRGAASRHGVERAGRAGRGSSLSPPLLYLPPAGGDGRRGPWAKPGRSAQPARGG